MSKSDQDFQLACPSDFHLGGIVRSKFFHVLQPTVTYHTASLSISCTVYRSESASISRSRCWEETMHELSICTRMSSGDVHTYIATYKNFIIHYHHWFRLHAMMLWYICTYDIWHIYVMRHSKSIVEHMPHTLHFYTHASTTCSTSTALYLLNTLLVLYNVPGTEHRNAYS